MIDEMDFSTRQLHRRPTFPDSLCNLSTVPPVSWTIGPVRRAALPLSALYFSPTVRRWPQRRCFLHDMLDLLVFPFIHSVSHSVNQATREVPNVFYKIIASGQRFMTIFSEYVGDGAQTV